MKHIAYKLVAISLIVFSPVVFVGYALLKAVADEAHLDLWDDICRIWEGGE